MDSDKVREYREKAMGEIQEILKDPFSTPSFARKHFADAEPMEREFTFMANMGLIAVRCANMAAMELPEDIAMTPGMILDKWASIAMDGELGKVMGMIFQSLVLGEQARNN